MIIPKNIQKKWKLLRQQGDIVQISNTSGISKVTIGEALRNGDCNEITFEAIRDFYKQREQLLKSA